MRCNWRYIERGDRHWRGHWLFGILDIWLTAVVGVEFFAWWRWGWTGIAVASALMTLTIAAGLIIERRMGKAGNSNQDKGNGSRHQRKTPPTGTALNGVSGMTSDEARAFAAEWIAAWNSHDLDRVLSHYAADIVFLSPLAQQLVGDGRVAGLPALRAYWAKGLAARPDLKFELIDVRVGHDCLTMLYRNHRGQQAAETCEFGADGKVIRSFACYG